jgi:Fe-S oxidoreductase
VTSLSGHRRELSYCATCPKLCRFSCPVSNAEPRETLTPWGKMTAAYEHLSGSRPLDASAAAATYACTGCMRCRTHCRHGNEVGLSLFAARAEANSAGVAPAAVAELKRRFRQTAPLGPSLAESREDFGVAQGASVYETPFFPGCSALSAASDSISDALSAARTVGVPLRLDPVDDRCCGYPLLAAGLEADFDAAADAFLASVGSTPSLVVGDPGCAWTLRVAYPRSGRKPGFEVKLWVDTIAERLASLPRRPILSLATSYHDACYLGRGLGNYNTPRKLLANAVGAFGEAFEAREDAGCSGGGGFLPRTMPDTAKSMAVVLARELGAPEKTIVTACPTARRMFQKAGAEALDLATVVARWLRS